MIRRKQTLLFVGLLVLLGAGPGRSSLLWGKDQPTSLAERARIRRAQSQDEDGLLEAARRLRQRASKSDRRDDKKCPSCGENEPVKIVSFDQRPIRDRDRRLQQAYFCQGCNHVWSEAIEDPEPAG